MPADCVKGTPGSPATWDFSACSAAFPEVTQESFCGTNTACNWGAAQSKWDTVRLEGLAVQAGLRVAARERSVDVVAARPTFTWPAPLPASPRPAQLYTAWEDAEEHAKKDVSSMVFNTFIWCQARAAGRPWGSAGLGPGRVVFLPPPLHSRDCRGAALRAAGVVPCLLPVPRCACMLSSARSHTPLTPTHPHAPPPRCSTC